MLAWSPILIQQIEIHALGFVLRKLQLNRHRAPEVAMHTHPYSQLILYLAGEGNQHIRNGVIPARSGDLFIIPPNISHGFSNTGQSRPLCLVLDYRTQKKRTRAVHRHLPQHMLGELHSLLAQVPTKGRPGLSDYPAIIAVIARLLEPKFELATPQAAPRSLFDRVKTRLRETDVLGEVARDVGYARDALSRRLKRDHGLGLRGIRDLVRLEAAQSALRSRMPIAEAAGRAGFDDPNYFARWFRRRTGMTPSRWKDQA
ncbi:MAG: helix-turn-helix transcriptional regulator [Opitutaceae bacterium]|nr:helix-turn-helix transcriptional regulator [Opitutaceae bacterium]